MIEQNYNELLEYAKALLVGKGTALDPIDIVNDAYIALYDKEFNFQDFKNKIKSIFINLTVYENGKNFKLPEGLHENTCYKCHVTKPIGAFTTYRKPGSKTKNAVLNICTECGNKRANGYRKTEKSKELNRGRQLKYRIQHGLYVPEINGGLNPEQRINNYNLARQIIEKARKKCA